MTFLPLIKRSLSTFFLAGLATFTLACGGSEPSVEELAASLCTCDALADGDTLTPAERATCNAEGVTYLEAKTDACLECLDGKLGDGASQAACDAAETCFALCGED